MSIRLATGIDVPVRTCVGVVFAASALLCSISSSQAQRIQGRVVDQSTRRPVAGAAVTLTSTTGTLRATTSTSGFFTLTPQTRGTQQLTVEMLGYAAQTRTLEWSGQDLTVPAFVLIPQALRLDTLEARARRQLAPAGMARSSQLIAGDRLARLEQQGMRVATALREIPGLRVHETSRGGRSSYCVEANRRIMSMRNSGCAWVAVIVDDVPLGSPAELMGLNLSDIESLQFLTPVEAGHRYGLEASARGAVVIWTRGRGPFADPARNRNN